MLHYSCSTCSIILFFSIVNISAIQVNLLLGNFYNVKFGRHIWKILESTFESRVNHLWRGNLGFSFEFFFCFKSVENMSKSYMYMFSEKLMSLFFTFFFLIVNFCTWFASADTDYAVLYKYKSLFVTSEYEQ